MPRRGSKILCALAGLAWLCLLRAWRALRPAKAGGAPRRVLVLGYAAVGDLVFFLPVLRALRAALPGARIVFLANPHPGTLELLPATGLVDEFWPAEVGESPARETARSIRRERFDAVILSQPTPARFFAAAVFSIPLRVGHCRPLTAPHAGWTGMRYLAWRIKRGLFTEEFERRLILNRKVWVAEDGEHTVSRNLRLLGALGLPAPSPEAARPELPRVAPPSVALPAKPIGLHLGSPRTQYCKLWPPEKWAQVCRQLAQAYGCVPVLLGAADEADAARRFQDAFGGACVNLIGRLGLLETFEVIRRCRLFLSSDTGLSKAAMAMEVPTASVWGPIDRSGHGALWRPELHLEIYREMPCSPCVVMGVRREGSGVINYATCGHHACLEQLTPEYALAAIRGRYDARLKS